MRLIFAGTPANAARALEALMPHHEIALVITRPDAPIGRRQIMTPSAVAQVAQSAGIPVLKTKRIGESEVKEIASVQAELAVVIAFGALIPEAALQLHPWWNIHFSLLPLWRGATPMQHSILHSKGAGVSLFQIDNGMDTGDIISQKPIELGQNETTGAALERFTDIGVEMLLDSLQQNIDPKPQVGEPTLAPKLSRANARLDLSKTANELHRAVLAFNPEPMAWLELDGQPFRVLESRTLGSTDWTKGDHVPGRVTLSADKVLLESAGGTQLELVMVQPASRQAMRAGDWFRGQQSEVKLV